MLMLIKNDEMVRLLPEGAALNIDGIHLSPPYAGWTHVTEDGDHYSLEEAPPPPDPDPLTPEEERAAMPTLTARELRRGLIKAGIDPEIVADQLRGIPDETQRRLALVDWEYATQFERMHPLIGQVSMVLDLTDEQIDAMWLAELEDRQNA